MPQLQNISRPFCILVLGAIPQQWQGRLPHNRLANLGRSVQGRQEGRGVFLYRKTGQKLFTFKSFMTSIRSLSLSFIYQSRQLKTEKIYLQY
jgi:hypothetical protein